MKIHPGRYYDLGVGERVDMIMVGGLGQIKNLVSGAGKALSVSLA